MQLKHVLSTFFLIIDGVRTLRKKSKLPEKDLPAFNCGSAYFFEDKTKLGFLLAADRQEWLVFFSFLPLEKAAKINKQCRIILEKIVFARLWL